MKRSSFIKSLFGASIATIIKLPDIANEIKPVAMNVGKISGYVKVTKEMMDDIPFITAYMKNHVGKEIIVI